MNSFLMSFVPIEWITTAIHSIFIFGVVGLIVGSFASKIPVINAYGTIIKAIAGILLIFGLFAEGYNYASKDWITKSKEYEEKIRIAEEKSGKVNEVIKHVFVDKVKVVETERVVIQEKLKDVSVKIDSQCKITTDTVDILNQAARGKK